MDLIVHTPDELLAGLAMPPLETVEGVTLGANDWLVVCAGFEDRSIAILQKALSRTQVFSVLLVNYEPFFPENKAAAIREMCQTVSIELVEVTYNRQEPSGLGATFLERLPSTCSRVFVDISAMSRLLIVQILVALGTRSMRFHGCFIAYAEARDYPPTQADAISELAKSDSDPTFSVLFLSSGVFNVAIIPELSCLAPAGPQTRLIAFPSLDAHQLTALRGEIAPSRFSFIEGVPPALENQWRRQVINDVNSLDSFGDHDAERYQTSTLDYRETLTCLLKLYALHAVHERLLISPTGSKMQTVAVGIFRALVKDVQIVYPTPKSFQRPDGYTFGVGALHLLPLGPFTLPPTVPDQT